MRVRSIELRGPVLTLMLLVSVGCGPDELHSAKTTSARTPSATTPSPSSAPEPSQSETAPALAHVPTSKPDPSTLDQPEDEALLMGGGSFEGERIEGAPIISKRPSDPGLLVDAETSSTSDSPKRKNPLEAALLVDPVTGKTLEGALIPKVRFAGKDVDPEALAKGLVDSQGNTVPAPFEPEDPSRFDLDDDGNTIVGFSQIANFKYVEPIAGKPETLKVGQFPESVMALDRKAVVMEGFMIPLDMDAENRVSVFFLSRNTLACCQGRIPDINEVVEVVFEEPVKFSPDILLRITGTFEVGEVFDEFGYLMSVYRMQGKVFELPWK